MDKSVANPSAVQRREQLVLRTVQQRGLARFQNRATVALTLSRDRLDQATVRLAPGHFRNPAMVESSLNLGRRDQVMVE